jgi:hypothetical protein
LIACLLAASAVARSGGGDVDKIKEEIRAARADKELMSDAKAISGKAKRWVETLWDAAGSTKEAEERWNALILAQEASGLGADKELAKWRGKIRTKILSEYADDAKKMGSLMGVTSDEETRNAIFAATKNGSVKAACLYSELSPLFAAARKGDLSSEDRKKLEETLARIQKDFGNEVDTRNRKWGDVAAGRLRAMNDLLVGKVAPEIEGKDLDGTPFKLSDYRGKVVVLDFWGNW